MIDVQKPAELTTYIYLAPPKQGTDEVEFINAMNEVLQEERFILIIEATGEASFSPAAKRELGKWFKSNKNELGQRCMALIRVGDGPTKLKRLKSKAMKLAMPCPYFVEPSYDEAFSKAKTLILKG